MARAADKTSKAPAKSAPVKAQAHTAAAQKAGANPASRKPARSMAASTKAAPAKKSGKPVRAKQVEAISHAATAGRRNIPTAEYQDAAEAQEAMDPRGPVMYRRARPLMQFVYICSRYWCTA